MLTEYKKYRKLETCFRKERFKMTAKFCLVKLTVSQALAIRNTDDSVIKDYRMRFKCVECGKAVRPYEKNSNSSAYFAHLKRNKDCSLSDKLITKAKSAK